MTSRTPWHSLDGDEVLTRLGVITPTDGLAAMEAERRLREAGPNVLPAAPPVTVWQVLLHQFLSPLIYILLAAAGVALLLGDFVDAGFILLVVGVNATLGTWQEFKAEKSAASLHALLKGQARVHRDGRDQTIATDDLVPGDIVVLESGNRVPADLRMLQARDLSVDEAFLTGESKAMRKQIDTLPEDLPLPDRRNLAFAGGTVLSGRGLGIVIATGVRTEVGRIARTVADTKDTKAPLVLRMERFARQISLVMVLVCLVVAGVALSRGMPPAEVFFLAVALAVSAIPEGLPVAVTVALSIATARMAKRQVIVRRLTAVEGLGSCTFIASDKTGTLTVNRQTARRIALPDGTMLSVTGEGYAGVGVITHVDGRTLDEAMAGQVTALLRAAVRTNEGTLVEQDGTWTQSGDAVDVALLALAYKGGVVPTTMRASIAILDEIPFESERAFSATRYREADGVHLVVKGAMEALLPFCTAMRTRMGEVAINPGCIAQLGETLSASGHRFLLIAEARRVSEAGPLDSAALPPLTVLGLVGLIDPPRPEVREAIARCHTAGIEVAMVTGDHPRTAYSIASELGIATDPGQVVTGRELDQAGPTDGEAVAALIARGRVFARVAPLQKLHIVEALRRQGHFVAVTGDGVNDAPALRAAHISVAMGSGSDVTKDTASLIITDDNFTSIEAGIEEGRVAYDNIRKVTYLLISTGLAEVLLLLGSLLLSFPVPLLAVQLLWLNLVTNGIQDVALAFEGGEPGTMRRHPRRPSEGIFDRRMIEQSVVAGLTMALVTLGFWVMRLEAGVEESVARNQLLLLFVLLQNVHVFNARSEWLSTFQVPLHRNRMLTFGVPIALGVHFAAMHLPFMQPVLRVRPLHLNDWWTPVGLALILLVVMELYKRVRPR